MMCQPAILDYQLKIIAQGNKVDQLINELDQLLKMKAPYQCKVLLLAIIKETRITS